jgi:hypothetical protein
MHQKAMELEVAREILAEVFGVRLLEVDEMIQNRFDEVSSQFPFRTPLKNRRFLWDPNRSHKSRENENNSHPIQSNSKKT